MECFHSPTEYMFSEKQLLNMHAYLLAGIYAAPVLNPGTGAKDSAEACKESRR